MVIAVSQRFGESAVRLSRSVFWASWADCLPVVSRHRDVAIRFVVNLEGAPDTPSLGAAASAMWALTGTMGFEPPSWRRELVLKMWNPRTWSQGVRRGCSTKQHRVWTDISGSTCCSTGYFRVMEFRCVPRLGQALVWR